MQYSSIITLWKRKITRESIILKAVDKNTSQLQRLHFRWLFLGLFFYELFFFHSATNCFIFSDILYIHMWANYWIICFSNTFLASIKRYHRILFITLNIWLLIGTYSIHNGHFHQCMMRSESDIYHKWLPTIPKIPNGQSQKFI